jgi:hypothetical protein
VPSDDDAPGKTASGSEPSLALGPADRAAAAFLVIAFAAVGLIGLGMLVTGILTVRFDLISMAPIAMLIGVLGTIHVRRRQRQDIRMMGPVTWGEHAVLQGIGLLIVTAFCAGAIRGVLVGSSLGLPIAVVTGAIALSGTIQLRDLLRMRRQRIMCPPKMFAALRLAKTSRSQRS